MYIEYRRVRLWVGVDENDVRLRMSNHGQSIEFAVNNVPLN